MNIYLLTNTTTSGYDTYDSAVVIAESEDAARMIHPDGYSREPLYEGDTVRSPDWESAWCRPESVQVELLGKSTKNQTKAGVICSSFNAG